MPLSYKHQAFVDSFLIHNRNATEAYCDVYGVSRKVGGVNGHQLLKNTEIIEAIKRRTDEMLMTPEEVLTRLADIGRGDVADLMALSTAGYEFELLIDDGNGNKIRNPKTKLIKKIRQKVTIILGKNESAEDRQITETELELYAADDAIMDIAKLNGMISDRTENLNIDTSTLTDEQIDRLLRGEKLANVIKRT
jgi:phage terminase small subunit